MRPAISGSEDPEDAVLDYDNDGVNNLQEFRNGTNPRDTNIIGQELPFNLLKTYRKPIQIMYMGYILLPAGHYEIEINWGGKTAFYKLGDEIRGYVIKDFKKIIEESLYVSAVSSAQVGNSFGDILRFKLNHSGLNGTVSRKYFIFFSHDPEMGKILMPHYVLPYKKLVEYNFDPNAEILFALELVENK